MRQITNFVHVPLFAIAAVASISLLGTGSAMAAEYLYGGGATFPAVPYVGNGYLNPSTPSVPAGQDARLSTNAGNVVGSTFATSGISAGSVFAAYTTATTNKVSYCQTGSGFGKNVLNTATGTATGNGQCKDFRVTNPATVPVGFSGANAMADFIGTDVPYSTTDYNAFLAGSLAASRAGIVQAPTIAGAIALPHNGSVDNVTLSTAQVCRIYSGLVSNWSSIPGVTGPGATSSIKVVYRTDGSGSSFALTRFLAAKCNGTSNVPQGFVFSPNQAFNSALPGGVSSVYGARAIGASGDNGVVTATLRASNASSIGYAGIGEVLGQSAGYATVDGFDPAMFGRNSETGAPEPLFINAVGMTNGQPNLLRGKVLDGGVVNDVPGSSPAAVKQCILLINPALVFSNKYPIFTFSYVTSYYASNGSSARIDALKNLYGIFYWVRRPGERAVLPNGYAYLDGVVTFGALVRSYLDKCVF